MAHPRQHALLACTAYTLLSNMQNGSLTIMNLGSEVVPRVVRITELDYQAWQHTNTNTSEDRCISTQDSIRAHI